MSANFSKNEDGFALVTALLVLVALTVIGIAATNTTNIEVFIAGNEKVYKTNFYLAEGAAKEAAAQDLEEAWVWEYNKDDFPKDVNNNFDVDGVFTQSSSLGSGSSYGVVDKDIPEGTLGSGHSIKIEGTGIGGRMNFFDLYGQSTENNSQVRIKMGFTKRL